MYSVSCVTNSPSDHKIRTVHVLMVCPSEELSSSSLGRVPHHKAHILSQKYFFQLIFDKQVYRHHYSVHNMR